MKFTEIEHKFVVGPDFDPAAFRAAALSLGPARVTRTQGRDTYYLTALHPGLIFRHRIDHERQELTVKERGGEDSEVRLEVNLRLDPAMGDQRDAVAAFLGPFRITWQGSLTKDLEVFYFSDCEVVQYTARAGDRVVRCVEFEALGAADLAAARAILSAHEQRLDFAGRPRERRSLFDLLLG